MLIPYKWRPTIEISFQSPSGLRDLPIKCCPSSSSLWGVIENPCAHPSNWYGTTQQTFEVFDSTCDTLEFAQFIDHWPTGEVGYNCYSHYSHLFTHTICRYGALSGILFGRGVLVEGIHDAKDEWGKQTLPGPPEGWKPSSHHPGPCGDPSSEDYKYNAYDWEGCMDDHDSSLFIQPIYLFRIRSENRMTMKWHVISGRVPKAALFSIKHWTHKSDKSKVPGALSQNDPMNPCNKPKLSAKTAAVVIWELLIANVTCFFERNSSACELCAFQIPRYP